MKKMLALVLAIALTMALTTTAFAGDGGGTVPQNSIDLDGGSMAVPVQMSKVVPTFCVVVPTAMPVTIYADGTEVTATDLKLVNNSLGAVKVTGLSVEGVGSWETVDYDTYDFDADKVDAKHVAVSVNGDKTTGDDAISFTSANFPRMDAANSTDSDEMGISYSVKITTQSTVLSSEAIVNVTFTVGWDT